MLPLAIWIKRRTSRLSFPLLSFFCLVGEKECRAVGLGSSLPRAASQVGLQIKRWVGVCTDKKWYLCMSPGTEQAGCCSDIGSVLSSRIDPDQIRCSVLFCFLSLKAAAPWHQRYTEVFLSTTAHNIFTWCPQNLAHSLPKTWLQILCAQHAAVRQRPGILYHLNDILKHLPVASGSPLVSLCKVRQLPEKEFPYRENVFDLFDLCIWGFVGWFSFFWGFFIIS